MDVLKRLSLIEGVFILDIIDAALPIETTPDNVICPHKLIQLFL